MKKIIMSIFMLAVLSACNTVEGAGRDLKTAGQKLENAADRNKR